MKSLGDRLRELRREHALTQDGLGQAAGLAKRTIQALEQGFRQRPEPDTLKSLAGVFGITVAELVRGTEIPGPKKGGRPKGSPTVKALVTAPRPLGPPSIASPEPGDEFHPCELVLLGRSKEAPRRGLFRILGGDPPLLIFREAEADTVASR